MARFSGSMQAFFLAGALAVGTVGIAAAADMPLPPPPVIEPVAPPQFSGWYLRGDVGYGFNQVNNFTSNVAATTPGFQYDGVGLDGAMIIGGGVGYQINNWFRTDLTAEYRTPAHFSAEESYAGGVGYGPGSDAYCGKHPQRPCARQWLCRSRDLVWIHALRRRGCRRGLPAVPRHDGFGALARAISAATVPRRTPTARSSPGPSWPASIMRSRRTGELELGYRYVDPGRITSNGIVCTVPCPPEDPSLHWASQDVRVGLRYIFADMPPPPPMPPIVSKY